MRTKFDLSAAMQLVASTSTEVEETTFGELLRAYGSLQSSVRDATRLRKWVESDLARLSAWEVTTAQLKTAAAAMINGGYKGSSVNRDINAIGSAYISIIKRGAAPKDFISPTKGVPRFTEAIRRVQVDAATLGRLRAISLTFRDKRFALFVHLLIDTGARKSELLERVWADLDLESKQITCNETKTGKPRVLHFTDTTAALITRFVKLRAEQDLIFPGSVPTIPKEYRASWRKLTALAGCPDLHQHDIRHDRARRLLLAHVPVAVAASIMGHSVQILERRYGHLATEDHKRAVEAAWEVAA